jgi:hypothetical protein
VSVGIIPNISSPLKVRRSEALYPPLDGSTLSACRHSTAAARHLQYVAIRDMSENGNIAGLRCTISEISEMRGEGSN